MAIFQRTLMATAAAATVFAALALPVGAQAPASAGAVPAPTTEPAARQAHRHAHANAEGHHAHGHAAHAHPAHGKSLAHKTEQLKAALQLTEAQQADWQRYQEALQAARPAQRMDRETFAQLTTPERLDRMRAWRAERHAQADRRAEATKAFYATLTAAQQKTFDAQTVRHSAHGMGHSHGMHHRGRLSPAEKAPTSAAPTPTAPGQAQ